VTQEQAEIIGFVADEIEKTQGSVTAKAFVEHARNPASPAHTLFDWNVKKAAEKHWEAVARQFLRSYQVVVVRSNKPPMVVRARVVVGKGSGYTKIEKVLDNRSLSERRREELRRDLISAAKRYAQYCELSGAQVKDLELRRLIKEIKDLF
jgi:hypothetical protein